MIVSMTGYGKSQAEIPGKTLIIEIRALNSKQTDITARLPVVYKDHELEIRNILTEKLIRGKVDLVMYFDQGSADKVPEVNAEIISNYYHKLKDIQKSLGIESDVELFSAILRMPEVFTTEKPEVDQEEWGQVLAALNQAIDELIRFRIQEGQALEKDVKGHITKIEQSLEQIVPFEENRITRIRERVFENLASFTKTEGIEKDRFEQELIYYLEKLDISEEKTRLKNHCTFFIETLQNDFPNGKKLGFISQEIGREINTIGSKANDADIQKLVVLMKDELEKIKEQILNVL